MTQKHQMPSGVFSLDMSESLPGLYLTSSKAKCKRLDDYLVSVADIEKVN